MKTLILNSLSQHSRRTLPQRGDTIIEVLIAIALISLILTGAYSTTHRSLLATRSSQEHSEALKVLEGQIEALRATSDSSYSTKTVPFCINPSDGAVVTDMTSVACNPPSASGAYKYAISITQTAATGNYTLHATWDSLGGGTNNVNLYYRFQ